MGKRLVEWFEVRSLRTGKFYEMSVEPKHRNKRAFVKVYQAQKRELMRQCWNLPGFTFKVLHYLEAVAKWQNEIPTPTELAGDLGLQRTSVYQAYAELKKLGVIHEVEGDYYLDPSLCWKGTEAQLEEAYRTIFRFLREAPVTPALTGVREISARYRVREG